MNDKLTIKHFLENDFAKEHYQASEGTPGYDLIAAETFFGKIFPRSGLIKNHCVSCDAGVIDSDYRGGISVIMVNNHPEETFTIRAGGRIEIVYIKKYNVTFEKVSDRIAQIVYMKKYNVTFEKVSDPIMLGKTKRAVDGFGSTGINITKKSKQSFEDSGSSRDSDKTVILNVTKSVVVDDQLEITTDDESIKKSATVDNQLIIDDDDDDDDNDDDDDDDDDLVITSGKAVLEVNDKTITDKEVNGKMII